MTHGCSREFRLRLLLETAVARKARLYSDYRYADSLWLASKRDAVYAEHNHTPEAKAKRAECDRLGLVAAAKYVKQFEYIRPYRLQLAIAKSENRKSPAMAY